MFNLNFSHQLLFYPPTRDNFTTVVLLKKVAIDEVGLGNMLNVVGSVTASGEEIHNVVNVLYKYFNIYKATLVCSAIQI